MPYGHRAILRARGLHSKHLDRSPGLLNGPSLAQCLWMSLEDAGRGYGVAIERVI